MENRKPTIEELLAAVQERASKPKKKKIENHSNTLRYIEEMGLESGTQAVPNYVIYWHYRAIWKGSDRRYKANKIVFFRTFCKKFKSHRVGSQRFYLLKEGAIELSADILKEALSYDKHYVRFKGKEEKEESGGEIPSNSSGDETP